MREKRWIIALSIGKMPLDEKILQALDYSVNDPRFFGSWRRRR